MCVWLMLRYAISFSHTECWRAILSSYVMRFGFLSWRSAACLVYGSLARPVCVVAGAWKMSRSDRFWPLNCFHPICVFLFFFHFISMHVRCWTNIVGRAQQCFFFVVNFVFFFFFELAHIYRSSVRYRCDDLLVMEIDVCGVCAVQWWCAHGIRRWLQLKHDNAHDHKCNKMIGGMCAVVASTASRAWKKSLSIAVYVASTMQQYQQYQQ